MMGRRSSRLEEKMRVGAEKCVGCETCIPYCNVGAISMKDDVAVVDGKVCVECWVCYRNRVCPQDCFEPTPLRSPGDVFKHVLSDPTVTSEGTGVPGRGTEEAKTNDVTGRFTKDTYGICIDMGRPGVGTYMRDVEKVAMAVAGAGVRFASPKETPLSGLMTDIRAGKIRDEYLPVHVLSVIIEGTCKREQLGGVLQALLKVEKEIETVFSLGIVSMAVGDGDEPLFETLRQVGLNRPTRGKVNVGLGKPLRP
jgi:Pyruvate/2-oxoacid:ferredoxin oxidoreductase delta subunit